MNRNTTTFILAFSLLANPILTACGIPATSEPTETGAPELVSSPEGGPATKAISETEVQEEVPPTEIPKESPADAPAREVSFANDVNPIIQSRCINCHGGDRIEEGLVFFTYEDVVAGSDNGPVVIPGDIEGSLMVELVANKKMPKKGPKLTPPQVQIITDWVAAGAPNN